MPRGYILGIGTNMDPERNVTRIIEQLLCRFGRIAVSRLHETEPVAMESAGRFINFCAFVATDLEPGACKAACVALEVELGRDRTHPASKTRDRPADVDLLVQLDDDGRQLQLQTTAEYLAQPAAEIHAALLAGQPCRLGAAHHGFS